MDRSEVLGGRSASAGSGDQLSHAECRGSESLAALRHERGSGEGRRRSLETHGAATDQCTVGVVGLVLIGLAIGGGNGRPFGRRGGQSVSRIRGCMLGVWPVSASGERVELFVVMAAEMRVAVEELQPREEVTVPELGRADAQSTTDTDCEE